MRIIITICLLLAVTAGNYEHSGGTGNKYDPVEQDANIRAYKYFMKNEPGFNVRDDKGVFNNGRWWKGYNPIKDYNWSLDYEDAFNQLALKRGIIPGLWNFNVKFKAF